MKGQALKHGELKRHCIYFAITGFYVQSGTCANSVYQAFISYNTKPKLKLYCNSIIALYPSVHELKVPYYMLLL